MTITVAFGDANLTRLCHRRKFLSPPPKRSPNENVRYAMMFVFPSYGKRWLGTTAESIHPEFSGSENAYEVLGVAETSSFDEVKASFRKLAKETHPDLVSSSDSDSSKRFVEILAAYEILSDPTKRAHYDQYLLTTRHIVQKHMRQASSYHMYASDLTTTKQMEVVEWLRWYRYAVKDILSERRLPAGTGYFDELRRELYSAIHSAYYGPEIQSLDLLPDQFEAEERSVSETPEVLHLVSGRDLFGIVRIADDAPKLSDISYKKLTSAHVDSDFCPTVGNVGCQTDFANIGAAHFYKKNVEYMNNHASDAYKDLELHVCGRLVAMATRTPAKESSVKVDSERCQDQIHIFLSSHEESQHVNRWFSKKSSLYGSASRILLGRISGLGTNPDESSCYVFNSGGTQTHVILKHRTPLVKHMHWFQLQDEASVCECRCTRAKLPSSKYWLFEPRCSMHDIGGWYIETYGRDKKNKNIPSQRFWDTINAREQIEKRLHPAVYLLALAYRTLDIENARGTKRNFKDVAKGNLFKFFSWCKKLV